MLLIKKARIHDGLGNILDNTDILIECGKIKEIGKSLHHQGAKIVDASDKEVFPGFIDAINIYGCRGSDYNDASESSDPISPQMNIVYSFDQDGMNFQEIYKYGVTASGISPNPTNVLAGQSAVFKTYGRNVYKMLVKENAAMIASISAIVKKAYGPKNKTPMTKMGAISLLIEALRRAENYKTKDKYDPVIHALIPVLEGNIPLFINCSTKSEMDAILIGLKDFSKIKIVLTGAYGLDVNRDSVKNKDISYIIGDTTFAMSRGPANMNYKEIIGLMNDDYEIAIGTCGDSYASGKESLLWNAIKWYKNGLASEEVLKRITSVPSKILGVDDKIGSIEVGKHADLSIWTNNPIETYNAQLEAVYIEGENILLKECYRSCW